MIESYFSYKENDKADLLVQWCQYFGIILTHLITRLSQSSQKKKKKEKSNWFKITLNFIYLKSRELTQNQLIFQASYNKHLRLGTYFPIRNYISGHFQMGFHLNHLKTWVGLLQLDEEKSTRVNLF